MDQHEQDVPSSWLSHVSADSIDATAEQVRKLGDKVLAETFDTFGAGKMAII